MLAAIFQGKLTLALSGGWPLSVTVTVTLRGTLEAALEAIVPLTRPVAALMLSPRGRLEALKVSTFPSGSLALSWSPTLFPSALDCAPGLASTGGRFGRTLTGMITVPERGGVPLSVTVTAKLSAPLNPVVGMYVTTPLGVTFTVPCAGDVLTLKV
jgi:hypothetical protein